MSTERPQLAVHDQLGYRVVALDKPLFTIGRGTGHDLQLAGSEVSRDHAEIRQTADGYLLCDRRSRYGSFINGTRVMEQLLASGDRVECGRTGAAFVFLLSEIPVTDEARSTGGELRQVAALLRSLREMGTERVTDEVLTLVLDSAIEATGAERGFIMLADGGGRLEMKLARHADRVTLPAAGFETSRKIPEDVFASGQPMVVTDLLESELAAVHTGTVALGIRHVLCVPLRLVRYVDRVESPAQRRNIGVLYLDSREKGRLLSPHARAALDALATEAALAIENARLYQDALEKARLDQELRTASRIQQALLPQARKTGDFFEAVGASIPSRAIGGDFFEYLQRTDGTFGIGLGDVTGKGPPAALLTALVQGILAPHAFTSAEPVEMVTLVNRVVLSRPIESRFVTLFLGVLRASGRLTYCNAAQNPPLLFTSTGVHRLETGGTLLGAFDNAIYEQADVDLSSGDTLVLYSDGITEATDIAGEEFGEARLREVLASAIHEAPARILDLLLESVRQFASGSIQHDDLTAVVLRYAPARE